MTVQSLNTHYIGKIIYEISIANYKGKKYTEYEAQRKIVEDLSAMFDFSFMEVKGRV